MGYPAYEDYQEGLYFDSLPSHWSEERIHDIAILKTSNVDKKIKQNEKLVKLCNYVDVYYNSKINSSIKFMMASANKAEIKRFQLKYGDVIFTKDSEDPFDIGIPTIIDEEVDNLVCGYHLTIVKGNKGELLGSYLYYALESGKSKYQFTLAANGVTRFGLTQQGTKNIRICTPPINEQQKIANFLDYKTQQIDQLIKKKQALIEKLNEQRIAVITQAVTKGIDKNAKMKPSGVDWLGDVPEHWEVIRAKFVSSIFIPQRNKPNLNSSSGIFWATMEDMKNDYIYETQFYVDESDVDAAGSKFLKPNAVIASCVGSFGIASVNKVDVIINQQLQAFIPTNINYDFLREVISISRSYFELIGTAATLVYVNQQGFENMPVPLPPGIEQKDIMHYLNQEKSKLDTALKQGKAAIKYLEEYRSSLITSAVTGKIDIRKVKLPSQELC